jgi:patatin-related protein
MVRSMETRLGIVLYGGVSLAVYENGVAQELFRATRGDLDEKGTKPTAYDLIKAIADTEIVVDILSGTSAGGINGILLAYALANAKDFRKSASLWTEKGDIMALLRKPTEENVASLLDSRGYYQTSLKDAFSVMDEKAYGQPYESEIDLFVTGTDVHGRVFTEFDDQGHPIDVKDHRTVFLLKYRPERTNEFSPETCIPALAKLARITSCFPVAFEPVHVCDPSDPPQGTTQEDIDTDTLLRRWGKLTHDAYFLDGGLLDNKPFSYTIDAIFGRLAESDVDRMLLYVEPDPEQFNDESLPETPNVAKAAGDALIGIPGYESIAGDLQSIAERNSKLSRYNENRKALSGLPAVDDTVAQPQNDEFRPLSSLAGPQVAIYLNTRLTQLRDRAMLGILKKDGELRLLKDDDRHAAKMLVDSFAQWPGDGRATLREFDVYYRLRRLYHLTYAIKRRMFREGPLETDKADLYADVRRRINHQIKMLEMVKYAMETALDDSAIPITDLAKQMAPDADVATRKWIAAQNILRTVLAPTPVLGNAGTRNWGIVTDPDRLREERRQRDVFMGQALRPRLDGLKRDDGSRAPEGKGNLLFDLDQQEREILQLLPPGDLIRVDYCRFIVIDSYLFAIESAGGIEAKDPIRTVRVSPIGDRFGFGAGKEVADKLCGRTLGHFGGFMKSSWRANDIMWGRLDGISQLLQCVLTPERVRALDALHYNFAAAVAGFDLKCLFPNTGAEVIEDLKRDLTQLPVYAQEHFTQPRADGTFSRFEEFQNRLIRAAQSEIVEQEIPGVMKMAIQQQIQWNQYKVANGGAPFLPDSQSWQVGLRQIDQAVLSVAQGQLSKIEQNPEPGQWTRFLLNGNYKVATESLSGGIPKPVALEIATQSTLVLQNCLTGVAGMKRADAIRSNPVFRFGLSYPLRAAYGFAVFQRTAPEFARSASAALVVLCVAALAAGIAWWGKLIHTGTDYNLTPFVILIVAPVLALLAQTFVYGQIRSLRVWLLAPLGAFLAALGMVNAGIITGAQVGTGWLGSVVYWLNEYRAPIWIGTGAALVASIPFRAVRRQIEVWLYDRRRRRAHQQLTPKPVTQKQPPEPPEEPVTSQPQAAAGGQHN